MVTMNMYVVGDSDRGAYWSETNRISIYLSNHETIYDVYKTMTHELIHACIDDFEITIDDEQEERLIFCMQWAEETLV